MIGVISWYLFSLVLAAVNLPLAYAAMKKLPSRGIFLLRPLGLLLWGTIFWWLTSIQLLRNDLASQVTALMFLLAINLVVLSKINRESFFKWIKENKLDAVTVRCFDLLKYNYTLCMALSVCNSHKFVAGCEGDLEAVFSMLAAKLVSRQAAWMANSVRIDPAKNRLTLSHCTIADELLKNGTRPTLLPHMESGLSVAIEGELLPETVTIFRFGHHFRHLHLCTGRIVASNMEDPSLCRCQVVVELDTDIKQWMNLAMGNHQVLVFGDWRVPLERMCRWKGVGILR